jgi:hypothetical protein
LYFEDLIFVPDAQRAKRSLQLIHTLIYSLRSSPLGNGRLLRHEVEGGEEDQVKMTPEGHGGVGVARLAAGLARLQLPISDSLAERGERKLNGRL